MKMKVAHFLLMLFCIAAISCNDDELQLTKMQGKPSSISSNIDNRKMFFFYKGNHLSEIKELHYVRSKSIYNYSDENNDLMSISSMIEDKNIADGSGFIRFRKEDGKIIIESSGEPGFDIFRLELELDNNNNPVKITDMGIFSYTGVNGEISKIAEGDYYAVFTYNQATKNLTRLVVYDKISTEEVASYDYEYDNNVGAVSKMGLPLWYYAYKAFMLRDSNDIFHKIYFNHSNNIIFEKVTAASHNPEQNTYEYIYKYNKANTPVSMSNVNSKNLLFTY